MGWPEAQDVCRWGVSTDLKGGSQESVEMRAETGDSLGDSTLDRSPSKTSC